VCVPGASLGLEDETVFLMDPDGRELPLCRSCTRITVASLPNLGQISQLYLTGRPLDTANMLVEAVSIASEANRFLYTQSVQPLFLRPPHNVL